MDGTAGLVLHNVTTADNGTYECRFVNHGPGMFKRSIISGDPVSVVRLRVTEPGTCAGAKKKEKELTEKNGDGKGQPPVPVERHHHVTYGVLGAFATQAVYNYGGQEPPPSYYFDNSGQNLHLGKEDKPGRSMLWEKITGAATDSNKKVQKEPEKEENRHQQPDRGITFLRKQTRGNIYSSYLSTVGGDAGLRRVQTRSMEKTEEDA
ncbi:hypothetical protein WMY93_014747 [Mugilogobius chulae]|uniref:Uncharacterized protein n=1 Tax=Mugilogobius chulae TaxID=88201 RepID=A0AAW0P5C0_9GOBI